MIWNPFRRQRRAHDGPNVGPTDRQSVFQLIERLLSVQLCLENKRPREAFSTLMTNKVAAGYVFGFHDACFQIFGLVDPDDRAAGMSVLNESYRQLFGEQAGLVLVRSSVGWQTDHEFAVGRQSGGEDFTTFKENGTPTLGLQRILSLGFDAAMVERTLNRSA
jgi:hypothetical protein